MHSCSQTKRLEAIEKKIDLLNHDEPSTKTLLFMQDFRDNFDAHKKAQSEHDNEMRVTIDSINETLSYVRANMIPAYQREANAENAKRWIKEQAKSGSFWLGVAMSIIGFFWATMAIIKQAIK